MRRARTREEWLEQAVAGLAPLFKEHGASVPAKVRVSVGFPLGSRKAIGQAFSTKCSKDDSHEVFISPKLADPAVVLHVLVHELVHAVVGTEEGHKGEFKTLARAVGLEGKLTATHAGEDLAVKLAKVAKTLGTFPHAVLEPKTQIKKQGTRMLKLECPSCGCIVRTVRKWLDAYDGVEWYCPCGTEFELPEDN